MAVASIASSPPPQLWTQNVSGEEPAEVQQNFSSHFPTHLTFPFSSFILPYFDVPIPLVLVSVNQQQFKTSQAVAIELQKKKKLKTPPMLEDTVAVLSVNVGKKVPNNGEQKSRRHIIRMAALLFLSIGTIVRLKSSRITMLDSERILNTGDSHHDDNDHHHQQLSLRLTSKAQEYLQESKTVDTQHQHHHDKFNQSSSSAIISDPCKETSLIITTNYIPIAPSIKILKETIKTFYQHLIGLCPTSKVIIVCDGLDPREIEKDPSAPRKFHEYVFNLVQEFPESHYKILLAPEYKLLANS